MQTSSMPICVMVLMMLTHASASEVSTCDNDGVHDEASFFQSRLALATDRSHSKPVEEARVPDLTCKVKGAFRWVSMNPTQTVAKSFESVTDLSAWKQFGATLLDLEDVKDEQQFKPYNFRGPQDYQDRLVAKVMHSTGVQEQYTLACPNWRSGGDDLVLVIESSDPKTKAVQVPPSTKLCTDDKKTVFAWAHTDWKHLPEGHCVVVGALDPTKGITLRDLTAELMGNGIDNLKKDLQGRERLMHNLQTYGSKFADGLKKKAIQLKTDAASAAEKLKQAVSQGEMPTDTGDLTTAAVKKLAVETEVDACLCCTQEEISSDELMSNYCKVAFALGGESQDSSGKHAAKVAIGSTYNLVTKAAGWVVPLVGGTLVGQAAQFACQYACELRIPIQFEDYKYPTIAKVPGLALSMFLLQNPSAGDEQDIKEFN